MVDSKQTAGIVTSMTGAFVTVIPLIFMLIVSGVGAIVSLFLSDWVFLGLSLTLAIVTFLIAYFVGRLGVAYSTIISGFVGFSIVGLLLFLGIASGAIGVVTGSMTDVMWALLLGLMAIGTIIYTLVIYFVGKNALQAGEENRADRDFGVGKISSQYSG